MNINLTLVGQFITFCILIWIIMKYIWPPIIKALEDRQKKIADGLLAAEQGQRKLLEVQEEALVIIRGARQEANQIIEQASFHSAQLMEEAKAKAKQEGQRIIEMAQGEIELEIIQAKEALKNKLATLAIAGAEKIIQRELDVSIQHELFNKLAAEI